MWYIVNTCHIFKDIYHYTHLTEKKIFPKALIAQKTIGMTSSHLEKWVISWAVSFFIFLLSKLDHELEKEHWKGGKEN